MGDPFYDRRAGTSGRNGAIINEKPVATNRIVRYYLRYDYNQDCEF